MYVGRNQLDAATIDRFIVVYIEYDERLEKSLAMNDDWVEKVQFWRKRAAELRERHVISMRASIVGAQLLKMFPENDVEEMVVWRGLDSNAVRKIKSR
jgi:cobaltochelatase CobS